jgi:hypothetical protein
MKALKQWFEDVPPVTEWQLALDRHFFNISMEEIAGWRKYVPRFQPRVVVQQPALIIGGSNLPHPKSYWMMPWLIPLLLCITSARTSCVTVPTSLTAANALSSSLSPKYCNTLEARSTPRQNSNVAALNNPFDSATELAIALLILVQP